MYRFLISKVMIILWYDKIDFLISQIRSHFILWYHKLNVFDIKNYFMMSQIFYWYHQMDFIFYKFSGWRCDICITNANLWYHKSIMIFISRNWLFSICDIARSGVCSLGMPSGPEFDPHVWHILSWRLGHENISTAILPLPLIQEEQLSVTGERMCTKYW